MAHPRRVLRTGPRRKMEWVGPANQGYVNVASQGATLLSSFNPTESITLIRTRGMVSLVPQTVTADVDIVGAFGMCIVSQQAFTAGAASVPEPFSDADWGGWFVWRSFAFKFEFATAASVNFPRWDFEIDSKGQRKIGPNDILVAVAESQAGAYSIATPLRQLFKLS